MLHGKGQNLIKNAINCLTGRGARLCTLTTYLIAAVFVTQTLHQFLRNLEKTHSLPDIFLVTTQNRAQEGNVFSHVCLSVRGRFPM